MAKLPSKPERIRRREIITARLLNNHAVNLDFLRQRVIQPPRDRDAPPPPGAEGDADPPSTYRETKRTTDTVQVFDQNMENYAEIDRIVSVSFQNSDGDNIELIFDNPE